MKRGLLVIAALALALSACEMRAEINVQENGSGTLSMVLGLPKNLGLLGRIGGVGDPLNGIKEQAKAAPFPVQIEKYENNRVSGFRMTIPFADTADLKEKLLEMQEIDALGAGGDPLADSPFSEFSEFGEELPDPSDSLRNMVLECSGGGCRFVLATESLPGGGGGLEGLEELTEGLLSLIDVQFRVSLPGRPGETNASALERECARTTFVWKATASGGPTDLTAETFPGGGCFPVVPVAAGAGAAVLIGVAVGLARRRPSTTGSVPMDGLAMPPPMGEGADAGMAPDIPPPLGGIPPPPPDMPPPPAL